MAVRRDTATEATIVAKYAAIAELLDERARRLWAAAESQALGYGGDALVSAATGLARETIRNGRRELAAGIKLDGRIRRPGAGRPRLQEGQPGLKEALEALVDPITRGDPMSPLRRARANVPRVEIPARARNCRRDRPTPARGNSTLGTWLIPRNVVVV